MNMVYMISYLFMEIPAGILYMPFMGLCACHSGYLLDITIVISCVPRTQDTPAGPFFLQGFHGALFFIWLDLLFHFGYKPHLRGEIDALVASKDKKAQ
ncbi:hypothetical protein FOZ60_001911 [Perkinsus olseni]|uniref:Uncharacterized protein n=1 Tax=Perkinsus olseni TaxID=32597 RepID=A0A7J6NZJ0_PEROL|nr:hypothetical protein FOZ60_001911 [Perkinsus olseni]